MIGYTGSPVIKYKNSSGTSFTINLPTPKKGGRSEKYDDSETKSFTNINGKRIKGKKRERFIGEYSFANVDNDILNNINRMYNTTNQVMFYPYSDLPFGYKCYITVNNPRGSGYVFNQDLRLVVKSVNYINERLDLDRYYTVATLSMFGNTTS